MCVLPLRTHMCMWRTRGNFDGIYLNKPQFCKMLKNVSNPICIKVFSNLKTTQAFKYLAESSLQKKANPYNHEKLLFSDSCGTHIYLSAFERYIDVESTMKCMVLKF